MRVFILFVDLDLKVASFLLELLCTCTCSTFLTNSSLCNNIISGKYDVLLNPCTIQVRQTCLLCLSDLRIQRRHFNKYDANIYYLVAHCKPNFLKIYNYYEDWCRDWCKYKYVVIILYSINVFLVISKPNIVRVLWKQNKPIIIA